MDRAAMDEAEFSDKVLHNDIVIMGVDTEMSALIVCPVDAEHADASLGTVGSDPVNNALRAVIQPAAFCDLPIGRFNIRSAGEKECTDDRSCIVCTDITVTVCNILPDQCFRRPAGRPPLIWISVVRYELPCVPIDIHDPAQILLS